jgi:hypothetical protein
MAVRQGTTGELEGAPSIAYVRFKGLGLALEAKGRVWEMCVTLGGTLSPNTTDPLVSNTLNIPCQRKPTSASIGFDGAELVVELLQRRLDNGG